MIITVSGKPGFRAWDKINKRMERVTLIDFDEHWISTCPKRFTREHRHSTKEGGHYYTKNQYNLKDGGLCSLANEDIDRFILMRSTERLDNPFNGKIIYESDILEVPLSAFNHPDDHYVESTGVLIEEKNKCWVAVEWWGTHWETVVIKVENIPRKFKKDIFLDSQVSFHNSLYFGKVVGNIYQNPELNEARKKFAKTYNCKENWWE